MLILGFESASPTASVAIMRDGILVAEYAVHDIRTHSETLMPMAEALMEECGLTPEQLDAVAVDCGPGSFTGVRIGVCTANAMGLALQVPVAGVCSLRGLYESVAYEHTPVCAILDARNENVYAAIYLNGSCIMEPEAMELRTLLAHPLIRKNMLTDTEGDGERLAARPCSMLFTGDGAMIYAEEIRHMVKHAWLAPPYMQILRAGAICSVANGLLQAQYQPDTYREATPMYLRPSQAERMWSGERKEN